MKCPNCKLNIKDDAQICIHCGMTFQNYAVNVPPDPNNTIPSVAGIPMVKDAVSDKEKYLRAYAGKKYDALVVNKFSIGTLLLGSLWLLFNRLYEAAWILFVKKFAISLILTVLAFLLIMIGLRLPFRTLIEFIAYFAIQFNCAKDYSVFYLQKANNQVSKIVYSTADEEERIKKCKKAGRPNLIAFLIPILFIIFLFSIISALTFVYNYYFNSKFMNSTDSNKEVVQVAEKLKTIGYNGIDLKIMVPEDHQQITKGNYYYIIVDNKDQSEDYALYAVKEDYKNYKGYILVYAQTETLLDVYVCVRNTTNFERSINTSKNSPMIHFAGVKDNGLCNYNQDVPISYHAKKLIRNKGN